MQKSSRKGATLEQEWKIQRDRTACDKPGCPLPTAKSYYTVLEWPACVRRDLCDACFHEVSRKSERPPIFWKAMRRLDGRKGPVLDLVSLRLLFDRLGEEPGERAQALRYFTSLLLLRKRMLKMVDPRNAEEEKADLVVVDPKIKEMEPVALHAPDLDLSDLGAVKDELLAALEEGEDGESGEVGGGGQRGENGESDGTASRPDAGADASTST